MTAGARTVSSDAERSRTLLATATGGALATMSAELPGYPFGSVVGHVDDGAGRPIFCLSALAEHTRNLAADPRASLLVTTSGDDSDRLAQPRLTLVGTVSMLSGPDLDTALDRYRGRHPATYYVGHDFSLFRMQVARVRYIGGFAHMSWVPEPEYAAAEPDPLVGSAPGIISHMNDDHVDALVAYCQVFGEIADVASAAMVGVDRYGMDMKAVHADGHDEAVRVAFPAPVTGADEVRAATIDLLRVARRRLGR
ncbi:MAG TPA: DUF2470 domain-containing protein [Pseudonocardia sp.]